MQLLKLVWSHMIGRIKAYIRVDLESPKLTYANKRAPYLLSRVTEKLTVSIQPARKGCLPLIQRQ